jgi:hypothetical protein
MFWTIFHQHSTPFVILLLTSIRCCQTILLTTPTEASDTLERKPFMSDRRMKCRWNEGHGGCSLCLSALSLGNTGLNGIQALIGLKSLLLSGPVTFAFRETQLSKAGFEGLNSTCISAAAVRAHKRQQLHSTLLHVATCILHLCTHSI